MPEHYLKGAYRLGEIMAAQGRTLVFGAGKTGMMGAVAEGALNNGGEVIGVVNEGLNLPHLIHAKLTRLEVTPDIQLRKARMSILADAFIALPGGLGTFDEVFECLTWAQLSMHHKPVGFLNLEHYYDPLLAAMEHAIHEGFIFEAHRKLFISAPEPELLLQKLDAYAPKAGPNDWLENP